MPSPAPNTYSFDGNGDDSQNLVQNEQHTLTVVNYRDYHYLIPDFAPFYAESLIVQFRTNSSEPFAILNEGIDYFPALQFIGASRATGKPVYGAISFNNLSLSGEIQLSYQTVGGEWTLDIPKLTELAANIIYNPRVTTWENVINPPNNFPPVQHSFDIEDLVGQKEVVEVLNKIRDAILEKDPESNLLNHITNYSNPHRVSKQQVGLGRVQNYAPATIAECIAAQSGQLYVTPIGLKAYFDSLGLDRQLQFVSLQEVVDSAPVSKILTFDLFLEWMRLYGGKAGGSITNPGATVPLITYPTDQATYVAGQFFKNTTFIDTTPGTVNRVITLTGNGNHTIPAGTGNVKITGRGALGGYAVPQFVTKTEVLSGRGNGSFTVPAGGNILSVRGQGSAGISGRTKKYNLDVGSFVPQILTSDNNGVTVSSIVVNSITPLNNLEFGSEFSVTANITVTFTYDSGTGASAPQTVTSNVIYNFEQNDNGSTHGSTSTSNGSFWNIGSNGELTADHETLVFSKANTAGIPTINTGAPHNLSLKVRATFELDRKTGNEIIPGNAVTTTINNALRTYPGSTNTSSPADRTDNIPTDSTTSTIINFSSPVDTVLEVTYQDYNAAGIWEIKRFYSTKITNPATGTSALIEDTDGTIVALPLTATGDWMSNRTSVTIEPTTAITTAYALQLIAAVSNSTRRVFEYKYVMSGTEVTIRVVSELINTLTGASRGADAVISLLGRTETYFGSADNNTVPQTRTDEIVLNNSSETIVTYNCPTGTSVILNYNEPNTVQPITHADTVWEISTSSDFSGTNVKEGTAIGKGTSFTITQWKPTSTDVLVNNTTYYVRAKWVRSNGTESEWSETRQFNYSTGVVNPPRDTELRRFCKGVDQWGVFADGNGGSYEKEISKNSPACGFVTTPPPTGITNNLTEALVISSLSTIPQGSTSTISLTVKSTTPLKNYRIEYYTKRSSDPDSSYVLATPVGFPTSFIGDSVGSTTVVTGPLSHDGRTVGAYNGRIKVIDNNNPNNTITSNAITVTFASVSSDIRNLTLTTNKTALSVGESAQIGLSFNMPAGLKEYNIQHYEKQSNSSEWLPASNQAAPRTARSDSGSVNLQWSDTYNNQVPITQTIEYRAVITENSNPSNTATTNSITIVRNGATGSSGVLTISSSDTDLFTGETERITVSVSNGPTTGATINADIYQVPQSQTLPTNADGTLNVSALSSFKIGNINIPVGTNGQGSAFIDNYISNVGSGGAVFGPGPSTSHNAGTYRTFAFSTSIQMNRVKSNEIFRTFNAAATANAKITIAISPTTVEVGRTATAQVTLSGFSTTSPTYTVRLYTTPPGGVRSLWPETKSVSVNSSGSGNVSFSYTNSGQDVAGNHYIEAEVLNNTGAAVPTPGGNTGANVNLVKNTSITLTSTAGASPSLTAGMPETLTVRISSGPVNQIVPCVIRGRYISGNSGSLNTTQNYDTPINVSTDGQGNGSATINGGFDSGFPVPSRWSRKAIIVASGVSSEDMIVTALSQFDNITCSITSSVGGAGLATITPQTNETLTLSVSGAQPNSSVQMYARTRYISGSTGGNGTSIIDPNRDYDTPVIIQTDSLGNGSMTINAGNNGSIPSPSRWSRTAVHVASGRTSNPILVDFQPSVIVTQPPGASNTLRLYYQNGSSWSEAPNGYTFDSNGSHVRLGVVGAGLSVPAGTPLIVLFTTTDGRRVFHPGQFVGWSGNPSWFGQDNVPADRIYQASNQAIITGSPHVDVTEIANGSPNPNWGMRLLYLPFTTSQEPTSVNTVDVVMTLHRHTAPWQEIARSPFVYKFVVRNTYTFNNIDNSGN